MKGKMATGDELWSPLSCGLRMGTGNDRWRPHSIAAHRRQATLARKWTEKRLYTLFQRQIMQNWLHLFYTLKWSHTFHAQHIDLLEGHWHGRNLKMSPQIRFHSHEWLVVVQAQLCCRQRLLPRHLIIIIVYHCFVLSFLLLLFLLLLLLLLLPYHHSQHQQICLHFLWLLGFSFFCPFCEWTSPALMTPMSHECLFLYAESASRKHARTTHMNFFVHVCLFGSIVVPICLLSCTFLHLPSP